MNPERSSAQRCAKNSPKIVLSVRYRVTCASGENPVVRLRVPLLVLRLGVMLMRGNRPGSCSQMTLFKAEIELLESSPQYIWRFRQNLGMVAPSIFLQKYLNTQHQAQRLGGANIPKEKRT